MCRVFRPYFVYSLTFYSPFDATVPPSYTRNTSRLLLLWFCFMPFALFSELQLWAILAAPLMTLVLGGIDEIGVALEEARVV